MSGNDFWTRKKKLFLSAGVVTVAVVVLVVVLVAVYADSEEDKLNARRCITDVCNQTAIQINSLLDARHDPCKNFFNFACGKFLSFPIPDASAMILANGDLFTQVTDMLEKAKPESEKSAAVKSAVQLFNSCLNHENVDKSGLETIKNMITEVLAAAWPMAVGDKWNGFDWSRSLARVMRVDPSFVLGVAIIPDPDDYTKLIPMLAAQPPQYTFPGSLKQTVCLLLPNCSSNNFLDRDIDNIINADLHNYFYSSKDRVDPEEKSIPVILRSSTYEVVQNFKKYSIADLQTPFPFVDWKAFFETLFKGTGYQVGFNFKVVADIPQITPFLERLRNDKRLVANMMALSVLKQWGPNYSEMLRKIITPNFQRNVTCSIFVSSLFGYPVGNMYLEKRMPADTISQAKMVTMKLREGFRKLLTDSTWLDKDTQKKALQKVDKIMSNVAAPPWVFNEVELTKYYKKIIDVDPKKGFVLLSRLAVDNIYEQMYSQMNNPINKTNYWPIISPIMTNAFYFPMTNSMYYPLGIIKPPFFSPGRPRAVTYGAFGYIAGHELTHGFDSRGKDFDENGSVKNWWAPETASKFQKGSQCFIEQYSGIRDDLTGRFLNGTLTLAENIADNGGVKAAYQAFKNSPQEKRYVLNGLEDYTEDQLFFIATAQNWCSNPSSYVMEQLIRVSDHAPDMYRAIVPFQNFPEFSKAFNCKAGSPMNPKKRCTIW